MVGFVPFVRSFVRSFVRCFVWPWGFQRARTVQRSVALHSGGWIRKQTTASEWLGGSPARPPAFTIHHHRCHHHHSNNSNNSNNSNSNDDDDDDEVAAPPYTHTHTTSKPSAAATTTTNEPTTQRTAARPPDACAPARPPARDRDRDEHNAGMLAATTLALAHTYLPATHSRRPRAQNEVSDADADATPRST